MYFLGSITGMSGAYSNRSRGASGIGTFDIPASVNSLYLVPSASGILFEFGVASSFQTTAARGAQLRQTDGSFSDCDNINGPFPIRGDVKTVSIYFTSTGVHVRVYAAD